MALLLVLSTRYVQRHGDNHGFYDNNALFKCEGVVGSGFGMAVIMAFQRLSDLWFLHLLMSCHSLQPDRQKKPEKKDIFSRQRQMPPIKEPAL